MAAPTEPAPAACVPGRTAREGGLSRVLRLPGATVEQLEQCVALAWRALKELQPDDEHSVDWAPAYVEGEAWLDERWLSFWCSAHVGSFLHEVARLLADLGQPALVEEKERFEGEAPFVAMTAYFPGKPAELRFFDPLRPETALRPIPESWLTRFLGYGGTVEQYALEEEHRQGKMREHVLLIDAGRVPASARFLSAGEPLPYSPEGERGGGWGLRRPLPANVSEGLSFAAAVLTLLLIAPWAVIAPVLSTALIEPTDLVSWSATLAGAWVLCAWLALIRLRWPSGAAISRRARVAWFGGLPVLVAIAWRLA